MLTQDSHHIIDILNNIEKSKRELFSNYNNPIAINCGYGYGRTGLLILFDQIMCIMKIIKNCKLTIRNKSEIQLEPIIYSIQNEIAHGAVIGINHNNQEKNILNLKAQLDSIIKCELIRNSKLYL